MKKIRLSFLHILVAILFVGCKSFKNELIQDNGTDNAIQNAIIDFSKTNSIYKKGVVFSVSKHELVNNKDLFVIRIAENNTKMLMKKEAIVDSKGKLASQYLKDDNGKLFFWWDDNKPLNQKTIDVFKEYDILTNNELDILDAGIDDSKKASHYYFCLNGLSSNYKKVITNKGIGYYQPPSLNCK